MAGHRIAFLGGRAGGWRAFVCGYLVGLFGEGEEGAWGGAKRTLREVVDAPYGFFGDLPYIVFRGA